LDAEWEQLRPLLPPAGRRGGRWRDHRQVINGIIWRIRTGAPWRDLVVGEGRGRPLVTRATPGQATDTIALLGLVDAVRVPRPGGVGRPRVRPDDLVADKASSSRANRGPPYPSYHPRTRRPAGPPSSPRWPAGRILPGAVRASQSGRTGLCPAQAAPGGGNPLRQAQAPLRGHLDHRVDPGLAVGQARPDPGMIGHATTTGTP
jgi:hypothetical protein